MCLAVPGRVVQWLERSPPFGRAEIEFDGVRRVCQMACVPDAQPGDYVIVHAGLAISLVDPQAAEQTRNDVRRFGSATANAGEPGDLTAGALGDLTAGALGEPTAGADDAG